jgi:predicted ester cyclase
MMRFLALMIFTVVSFAQQQQPSVPKGPAQIAHWFVDDAWNRGDLRLADQLFTPDAVLHYRGQNIPLTAQTGTGIVRNWRTAFPDFHFALEDMIIEGNKVVLRIPFTGTHRGKFMGAEPTGKTINVSETLIIRLEGDRIAEMWEDYDEYGMRIQLGLLKAN